MLSALAFAATCVYSVWWVITIHISLSYYVQQSIYIHIYLCTICEQNKNIENVYIKLLCVCVCDDDGIHQLMTIINILNGMLLKRFFLCVCECVTRSRSGMYATSMTHIFLRFYGFFFYSFTYPFNDVFSVCCYI